VSRARPTYADEGVGDVRLAARAPFHLEATVRVLQRRPSNPVDLWEQGRYFRVLTLTRGLALVEVDNRGTIDDPDCKPACNIDQVRGVTGVQN
jgi:hypothetical protein